MNACASDLAIGWSAVLRSDRLQKRRHKTGFSDLVGFYRQVCC